MLHQIAGWILGLLFFCAGLSQVRAQSLSQAVQELKAPTSSENQDLSFLKDLVKDKRIILLGESSHGAAEFYEMKSRIARYLVQEVGFEVIAFESGLFECQRADDRILEKSPEELVKKCLMWELFTTKQVVPLFQFVQAERKLGHDVHLAGFDSEIAGRGDQMNGFEFQDRAGFFRKTISPIDAAYAEEVFALENAAITANLDLKHEREKLTSGYGKLSAFLTKKESALVKAGISKDVVSMLQQIASRSGEKVKFADSRENRDGLMAKNVEWLLNTKYPGKKIVLWAHNSHVGYQDIPFQKNLVGKSMASFLRSKFAGKMYSIGLFMGEGKSHMWGKKDMPVQKPLPGSLEQTFIDLGKPFVYLDLTRLDAKSEGGKKFHQPMKSYWWGGPEVDSFPLASQHDGILFIRSVRPPEYIK